MATGFFLGGGGGSGPALKEFAPKYVVGNALAGDTTANCDFLDPGNGSGIAAAFAASTLDGGDVWIRPGTYDLGAVGAPVLPLDVPARVNGAGRNATLIVAPASGLSGDVFNVTPGAQLLSLTIDYPVPTAAFGSATGAVALRSGSMMNDVTINLSPGNTPSAIVGQRIGVLIGGNGTLCDNVLVTSNTSSLFGSGLGQNSIGFAVELGGALQGAILNDCTVSSIDVGLFAVGVNISQFDIELRGAVWRFHTQISDFQDVRVTGSVIFLDDTSQPTPVANQVAIRLQSPTLGADSEAIQLNITAQWLNDDAFRAILFADVFSLGSIRGIRMISCGIISGPVSIPGQTTYLTVANPALSITGCELMSFNLAVPTYTLGATNPENVSWERAHVVN